MCDEYQEPVETLRLWIQIITIADEALHCDDDNNTLKISRLHQTAAIGKAGNSTPSKIVVQDASEE